jgi:hypothetical protein
MTFELSCAVASVEVSLESVSAAESNRGFVAFALVDRHSDGITPSSAILLLRVGQQP